MDKERVDRLRKHYDRLAAQLTKLGPIVQGTITERTITKEDPRDPQSSRIIGPYYQWTFKRNAKTVTVNLSAEQVKPFQRAIDKNRKLEAILTHMRELSCEILEATTKGVRRRKNRE
jgi:hypothetical protein